MDVQSPQNVKYFIALLSAQKTDLDETLGLCQDAFGPLDLMGEAHPFDQTNYYETEMGTDLVRRILGFERLQSPGLMAPFKLLCNDIEAKTSRVGKRQVNLDLGYLDLHKLVLASAKYNGQKIYLDQGIYADTTLLFQSGKFVSLPNTFPDFKSGAYDDELMELRAMYKRQLKDFNSAADSH